MDGLLATLATNGKDVALYSICLALIGLLWRVIMLLMRRAGQDAILAANLGVLSAGMTTLCEVQREMAKDLHMALGAIRGRA